MCLWLSTATRDSADIGSPCVPEISTVTFDGFAAHDVLRTNQNAVGNVQQPVAVRDFGDRPCCVPTSATFRPNSCEISIICCRR